ncbi:major facilitator superfamily domain-containing protein [Bombardia bombarda]|uniref:Major facilitator superfamily domain-containing protein n=1 Tax=Bombardia bombarda TaxID=252184 RepID=A0AA39XIJ9_9PEZI|nr:major facilitator superfamily domain-containing protein [Bombardia bombarda]
MEARAGLSSTQFLAIVFMNIIGSYVSGYDVSNLANIQAPIYEAFGHIELLSWVSVAYSLANAATVPVVRKIATMIPLRPLAFVSLLSFVVGATICGAAPSIRVLIVGRVLNGMGAAGVYQVNQYYNVSFCKPAELARMQSLVGLCWALGIISGPIIGGAFADNPHATWRWAFYINLPLCAIIFPTLLFIPSLSLAPATTPLLARLSTFDYAGALLHIASLSLLSITLLFSGSIWPWSSAPTIALWILTTLVLLAYLTQQSLSLLTTPHNRIMPVHLLTHRTAALTAVGTAASATTYAVTMYYSPLFFAFARGHSPLGAAVRLLPFICVLIVFIVLSGGLLPAARYYAPYYLAAGALYVVGGALLATAVGTDTDEARVMGFAAILGAATGLTWQTALGVTGVVLPGVEDRFDAAALQSMAQLVPVVVSLSIAGCVYQNLGFSVLKEAVGPLGFGDGEIREALAGVASRVLRDAGDDGRVVRLAVEGLTRVITSLFWIVVAMGVVCFGAACGMRWEALDFKAKGVVVAVADDGNDGSGSGSGSGSEHEKRVGAVYES